MGRSPSPCCDESTGVKKGPWTPDENEKLVDYIQKHGHGNWKTLPKLAGLNRCGKSCRLRWVNYLRPDIKRGKFEQDEEEKIIQLHSKFGNRWSVIASHLPGRTDNEIKNYWNTKLKKKLLGMGIDPATHQTRPDLVLAASILSAYGVTADAARLVQLQLAQGIVEAMAASSSAVMQTNRQIHIPDQITQQTESLGDGCAYYLPLDHHNSSSTTSLCSSAQETGAHGGEEVLLQLPNINISGGPSVSESWDHGKDLSWQIVSDVDIEGFFK